MNLNKYLEVTFPNLKLQRPLFYNWKYGLRFEIGLGSMQVLNLEYFEKALERAIELFKNVFEGEDEIIIVCQRYSSNRQKIKKRNFCFLAIDDIESKKVESFKIKNIYLENHNQKFDKKEHYHRVAVHLKVNEIKYQPILNKLIYGDFTLGNVPEIYFINRTKDLIFQLYDDRGLDIISKEKPTLQSTYKNFNSWILDYNRKEIDALFK